MTENTTPPVTNTIKGTRKAPTKKPKASPKKTFKINVTQAEYDSKELHKIVERLVGVVEQQTAKLKDLHKEIIEQDVRIDALQKRLDRFVATTEEDIAFLKDELRHVHLGQLDNDICGAEKLARDAEQVLAKAIAESNGDDAATALRLRDSALEQIRKKTYQRRLAEIMHEEGDEKVAPLTSIKHV